MLKVGGRKSRPIARDSLGKTTFNCWMTQNSYRQAG